MVHFIGHLQTNKVKQLAPVVDVWQSVDRVAVVEALERHAAAGRAVLVQVNVSRRSRSRAAASPTEAPALVDAATARRAARRRA